MVLHLQFGEDPYLTGVMATECIKGIENNGIINTEFSGVSSIKHYLGYPAPKYSLHSQILYNIK